MFLSYAVVPVFVFTILLNFFCLYSPIGSQQTPGQNFTTCEECLNSTCHLESNGTCALDNNNITFLCISCTSAFTGIPTFPCENTCKQGCTNDTKECVCDGPCYLCLDSVGLNKSQFTCTMPIMAVSETCALIPYGPSNSTNITNNANSTGGL